jgi:5-methylcytosine-specific restriction enzyme A
MPAQISDPAAQLPWRDWYGLQRWKRRAHHQLLTEPLCRSCRDRGRIAPASIADHVVPHRGNWNAFRLGALQSLCADCHKGKWATDRRGYRSDIGRDGLPTDPRHPFNSARP